MAASSSSGDRRQRLSAWLARPGPASLAFALVLALLSSRTLTRVAAAWAFTTDDAYITLRYARHLVAGEGLVWNLGGERVEGYSNFASLLLAAGFGLLGELDVGPLKLVGVAGLLATGYLQWAIARRFLAPLPALLPFALLLLARGSVWWAVSGLETGVYMALTCAVVLASLRGLGFERVELGPDERIGVARGPIVPAWLGVAGGLGLLASLTRPEGPMLMVAVGLAALFQRGLDGAEQARAHRAGLVALVLGFAPGFAVYLGWRLASFGEWLPNSVRCKAGFARGDDRYTLLRAYWATTPVTLVVAALQPVRELDARVVLPGLITAGYLVALIGADPVVGNDLRHFLAAHALVCVLASVAAVRLAGLVFVGGRSARVVELGLVGDVVRKERSTPYGCG